MTNLDLAIAAWSAVRKSDDAVWIALPMGIKAKLTDLAGKYRNGAKVAEGDYPPEGFAEKCVELASRQEFFVVGAGDGSAPELVSAGEGKVQTGIEHEDTQIPSPNPEDVDPLKSDIEEAESPKGKLPADFPSHDLLHDAGINTYGQLIKQRDSEEGLEGVDGIGPALAKKIEEALNE